MPLGDEVAMRPATASGTSVTPVREALRSLLGERAETIEHHPMLVDALRRRDAKIAAAWPGPNTATDPAGWLLRWRARRVTEREKH
jgi:hypothetical protein